MASSNFKVFAEAVAALNVVSDAEYATDTQRINGVVPGLASAALHNKLYKQATIMAAARAQVLVAPRHDAWDSDYAGLVASIKKTFMLSLNGEKPDAKGNLQKNFVYSVEGRTPDKNGNVALDIDYLNAMSFVGSVVITKENINPGTKIGGTWQLLQSGRYIRSAGDSYAGGALGGSETFTLSVNQLPAHSHGIEIYGSGSHTHVLNNPCDEVGFDVTGGGSGPRQRMAMGDNWPWNGIYYKTGMNFAGNHNHQAVIKSTGNGEKVTFEPSYLCLYFWVRTA
ncbi:phage baseplate protein [Phascolarctobacterium succinatutens]|uniref:phage baseplate protein n=1 Tax=Phascolarctobacterium succinatutens TaxID=626940 RepID=UPI0023F6D154|nr:hypothetical protein [Phascolarctobacterium succinatutens]